MHERNCFITLTYSPENVPADGSLNKTHFQLFMKRLRKHALKESNSKISFFHCGEYGDRLDRPHYHALIFGYDFSDKTVWKQSEETTLWRSPTLERLWPGGFSTIGPVNFQTAAYCASYVVKKITGHAAAAHYGGKLPEYVTMSLKPAIGKRWLDKWQDDVYPADTVVMRGQEALPPRYYDEQLKKCSPELYDKIKKIRIARAEMPKQIANSSPVRLNVRETVTKAKRSLSKRKLHAN